MLTSVSIPSTYCLLGHYLFIIALNVLWCFGPRSDQPHRNENIMTVIKNNANKMYCLDARSYQSSLTGSFECELYATFTFIS